MKSISETAKSRILSPVQKGLSIREVTKTTGISKSTVSNYRAKYLSDVPRPSPGRPRILSVRQERNLVRLTSSGRCVTAEEAQRCLRSEYGIEVCTNTLRRTFRRNGLQSRVQQKKPLLRKTSSKKIGLRSQVQELDRGRPEARYLV